MQVWRIQVVVRGLACSTIAGRVACWTLEFRRRPLRLRRRAARASCIRATLRCSLRRSPSSNPAAHCASSRSQPHPGRRLFGRHSIRRFRIVRTPSPRSRLLASSARLPAFRCRLGCSRPLIYLSSSLEARAPRIMAKLSMPPRVCFDRRCLAWRVRALSCSCAMARRGRSPRPRPQFLYWRNSTACRLLPAPISPRPPYHCSNSAPPIGDGRHLQPRGQCQAVGWRPII